MNGVTDFATGVKAASDVEKNKSKPKFNIRAYNITPSGMSISSGPNADTNGLADAIRNTKDSIRKANAWD